MGKLTFPWLAFGMGLLIATAMVASGAWSPEADYDLPLLTMMIVNEFGFFVTAIGAGIGINTLLRDGVRPPLLLVTVACAVMAAGFLYLAIKLWPGLVSG